jgi:hypothetical protein
MALVISDRVKETTVTTGTGTVTLAGAVTGFRTFASVLSANDTTYYAIVSSSEFEVGVGTFSGGTLSRDTVLSSSNSNAKVNFGAGSKNVFITQPADKAIYQDASGNVAGLNTDNVTEGSTNLYFTDERVDDRVGSLLVAGDNVTLSYDDAAGTLTISATEDNLSNNTTDDLAEGSTNLYYTSARANADFDTRLATKDTDDVSEGATNLYYTDARADARVNLQTGSNLDLSSKSTSDLSEGTNLYYTDARFDTRLATKTTDNLTEGSSNLYHTTERVQDIVGGQFVTNGSHTGISFVYDDSTDGGINATVSLASFSTSDLSEGTNLYYTTARFDSAFSGKSTSDLSEGTNLYYTTARFDTAFSGKDTDDLSEGLSNLYYTDERVDDRVANLIQNGTGISFAYNDTLGILTPTVSLSAFDTDNLSEGSTNLYYTDTRANAAIDARVTQSFVNALNVTAAGVQANSVALGTDTTGNYIATIAGTANKITVTGSGSEAAAVTLTLPDDVQIANDLTVAGDLTVNGATTTLGTTNLEVSDNLFELNAGLTTAPVNDSGMLIQRGTSDNAIFMWDESADKFTLGTTTSDATVTGNIVITTGSLVANLEGNVTGNVTGTVSSLSNHNTGDLAEGSNLYYTTARFDSAFSGKSTSDLSEGSNLYHTSERVQDLVGGQFVTNGTHTGISFAYDDAGDGAIDATVSLASFSTSDLSEGTNLYYTDTRFDTRLATKTTDNLSEGASNLYFTNERVDDRVASLLTAGSNITLTYDDTAGTLTIAGVEDDLSNNDTDDLSEGATNLYYTDARVESYLDGGTSTPTFASATVSGDLTVDTSTLKVDSTNNRVGIGTASPNASTLHIDSGGLNSALFLHSTDTDTFITISDDDGAAEIRTKDGGALQFRTGGTSNTLADSTTAITIDSSQNVGIGTTSPAHKLHLDSNSNSGTSLLVYNDGNSGASNSIITSYNTDINGARSGFGNNAYPSAQYSFNVSRLDTSKSAWAWSSYVLNSTYQNQSAMTLQYVDASGTQSERLRIDSSGSLLIGKTSLGIAGDGFEFGSGVLAVTRNDGVPFVANRRTSDGDVISIRKDNTSVGVIGTQNWGIGTSSPSNSLEIQYGTVGTGNGSNNTLALRYNASTLYGQHYMDANGLYHIRADNNGAAGGNLVLGGDNSVQIWTGSTPEDRVFINSSGNVGIGTSSPTTNTLTITGKYLLLSDSQTKLGDNGIIGGGAADGNSRLDYYTGKYFSITQSGTERMRITDGGQIKSIRNNTGSESYINLELKNTATSAGLSLDCADGVNGKKYEVQSNPSGNFFVYDRTASAYRFLIDSSGNVGIGTSSPAGVLDLRTGISYNASADRTFHVGANNYGSVDIGNYFGYQWKVSGAASGQDLLLSAHNRSGASSENLQDIWHFDASAKAQIFLTNHAERMRIDSSGNIILGGSGTLPSSSQGGAAFRPSSNERTILDLATALSSNQVLQQFINTNGVVGNIATNGTATAYNTSSDYRLKENVVYDWTALDRLNQLKPARFNFIADADTTVDGFLAHEVQDIVPEAITGEKDAVKEEEYEVTPAVLDDDGNVVVEAEIGTREVPDYQGIDQSKLVPLLTKAVQELSAKVEALEAQLQGN